MIPGKGHSLDHHRANIFGDCCHMHDADFSHPCEEISSGWNPVCHFWSPHVRFTTYHHGMCYA